LDDSTDIGMVSKIIKFLATFIDTKKSCMYWVKNADVWK